jgi:hypothetical protein
MNLGLRGDLLLLAPAAALPSGTAGAAPSERAKTRWTRRSTSCRIA